MKINRNPKRGSPTRFSLRAHDHATCHIGMHRAAVIVSARLVELGRRRMVGGQEDMIVDVALDLVARRAREDGDAA